MKKAMKSLTKRALALILVFAMAVAYLPMTGIVFKASAASASTMSFSDVPASGAAKEYYMYASNKFLNLNVTGVPDGAGASYSNKATADYLQTLYDKGDLTVSGDLTIEDLKSGLFGWVLATGSIYQMNWNGRTEGFPNGSFTLKQGTELPVQATAGNVNVALDAEYTFTFSAGPNDTIWNTVNVTKAKETSFSLNVVECGTNAATFTYFDLSWSTAYTGVPYQSGYLEADASYANYIDFAGIPYDTVVNEYGVKIEYILTGSAALLRIHDANCKLRNALKLNDEIIVEQGFPVPYKNAAGDACVAQLDADYVFKVSHVDTNGHKQILQGLKYDSTRQTYTMNSTGSSKTGNQGADQIFNVGISSTGEAYLGWDIMESYSARQYMEFSGFDSPEAAYEAGFNLLYIGGTTNVLQFQFAEANLEKWKVGDTILLKKGMPYIFKDTSSAPAAGKVDSVTLNQNMLFIITGNDGSELTVERKLYDEFSAVGTPTKVDEEGTPAVQYMSLFYDTADFADYPGNTTTYVTTNNADVYNYISVNGSTGEELKNAGYSLRCYWVGINTIRLYKNATDFPVTDGSTIVFKKGMPVDYTNTSGMAKRVVLDKDYGFVYDGTNYVYNPDVTFPETPAGLVYGLTTKLNVGGTPENDYLYYDSAITGSNVNYSGEKQINGIAVLDSYIDFSHCTNAEAVKSGITVKMILASATVKVLRVQLNDTARAALRNGDYITLKKGMPITLSTGELTTLDQDYEINIVSTNEVKVNFTVPAGDFALNAPSANVQGPEGGKYFVPLSYDNAYLADMAAKRQVIAFNEIQNHILVSGMDTAALSAAGWDIQVLPSSEAPQFRVRYDQAITGEDVAMILKAGLPVTYVTAGGVYKTAHLDKTYGFNYVNNNGTYQFLYDSGMTTLPTVVVPEDHTPNLGGYPSSDVYPYVDYLCNENFAISAGALAVQNFGDGNVTVENGIARFDFTVANQTGNHPQVIVHGNAVKGHTYVISYWVYVSKVSGGLSISPFSSGATHPGGPTPSGTNNYLETLGANDDYTINISAPFKSVTDSWQQVVITWTAKNDGAFEVGLIRNPNKGGTGTVYLDDVMCFDTFEPEVITNDQGGFSLSTGVWYKGDSNASQGNFINIPLTNNSLKGLHIVEGKNYWYSELNYKQQKDLISFFGLTPELMQTYGVKLKLIRDEAGGVMCLQIEWGSSLDFIQPGTCLTLKEGLQFTYEYNDGTETKTYGQKLLADYTLIRYVGRDQNSTLMAAIRTSGSDQPGDYDGNKDVDKKDVRLNRLYLCEMFTTGTLQIDANEDGTVDAKDLVLVIKGMDTGLLTEHNMYPSIQTAEAMTDRVVLSVADDNSSFTVGNMNTTINHGMGTNNGVMSLLDVNGVNVLEGATMTPFVTYGTSGKLTETNYSGEHPTRANNTVMGYYYNSLYFRDMDWRNINNTNDILWVEKAYHMYAGKQHEVFRMVNGSTNADATTISTDVKTFGFELVIPYDKFDEYAYKLVGDDTYTELGSDATNEITAAQNVEYVAIKNNIDGAGDTGFTFGFIFAGTNRTGSYVDIISDGDYLTIRQYVNVTDKSVKADCQVAHRLYVERGDGQVGAASRVDSFDGINNANEVEKTPLVAGDNITIDENVDEAKFRGYDYATGLYNFDIDGYHFGEADQDPDKKFMAGITVHDSTVNRVIYICVNTENELEGAVVLDKNDVQLPIALQVNKNFGHENEEPIYHPESTTSSSTDNSNLDYIRGESFMPLLVNVDTTQSFSIVHVYQNWGGFRLKQLSSIEYYLPYYHLSTGVTETTCIAPFGTAYRDTTKENYLTDPEMYSFGLAWLLPDFRGASNDGQYIVEKDEEGNIINIYRSTLQKDSGGTVFGPNSDKGKTMDAFLGDDILSSGLSYADIVMNYKDRRGRYTYTLRHMEMPQEDESRTYYTVEFTMLEDCTLTQDDFNIMAIGSRGGTYNNHDHDYTKATYLGADGQVHDLTVSQPTKNTNWLGTFQSWSEPDDTYTLNPGSSYFTFYGLTNSEQENANVGIIVKSFTTNNETAQNAGLAFRNTWIQPTAWQTGDKEQNANWINYGALVLNGDQKFTEGQTIKLELVLLSYGETVQDDCDNVKNVYADTVENPFHISNVAEGGQAYMDGYLPVVESKDNVAEFTVSGGTIQGKADDTTIYTVKVTGFDRLQKPVIYEKINGNWVRYKYSSSSRFDGYTVHYEGGGKVSYSFVIEKGAEDRTFGISLIEQADRATLNFSGDDFNNFNTMNVEKTLNEDGTITISGNTTDGYIFSKGLLQYAPASQMVTVRFKVNSGNVNNLVVGFYGEYYDSEGVRRSYTDFEGANICYFGKDSFGTADEEGWYTMTFDIRKNPDIEWFKIRGMRIGFGASDTNGASITIDKMEILE